MGKGRDVGMQQIYKFEAKLAAGNGEQCLSRDVYRVAQRLDFNRLLSFFYSGQGFYLNQAATVFAIFFFTYVTLFSHILQVFYFSHQPILPICQTLAFPYITETIFFSSSTPASRRRTCSTRSGCSRWASVGDSTRTLGTTFPPPPQPHSYPALTPR